MVKTEIAPWYRQPWFWFVISPLMVVVCVSLTFATVAFFHADDRVVDNYYKQGRAINQSFEQEARARELNLAADVRFDLTSGEVLVELAGEGSNPEILYLLIGHPVSAELDQQIQLRPVREGHYRGDLRTDLSHRRYLTLLPDFSDGDLRSAEWLLRGEIQFEQNTRIALRPTKRGQ